MRIIVYYSLDLFGVGTVFLFQPVKEFHKDKFKQKSKKPSQISMSNYNKNYNDNNDKERTEGWLSSKCHKLFTLVVTLWTTVTLIIKNGLYQYQNEELSTFKTSKDLVKMNPSLSIVGGVNDKSEPKKDDSNQEKYPLGFDNLLLAGEKIFPFSSTSPGLENIYLLDNLINWQRTVLRGLKDIFPVDFFSKNFNGYSTTPPILMLLERIHENNPLKKIGLLELFYHNNEINNCGSCRSDYFLKYKVPPTTAERLEAVLRKQIPSLVQLKITNRVHIFLVNLINCKYLKNTAHVSVLVIATGNDNEPRAYYCDSNGCDMPNILKDVLITKLQIKVDNYRYSTFSQQLTNGFCPMFVLENSIILGGLMLKKASFDEIGSKLIYRPTEEHLLEIRKNFFTKANDRFSKSLNNETVLFSSYSDKIVSKLERHFLLIGKDLSQEFSVLTEMKGLLVKANQDVQKLQCSSFIEQFFTINGQIGIRACSYYLSKLNFEYYSHLENELMEIINQNLSVTCYGCIAVLSNKALVKAGRRQCYQAFLEYLLGSPINSSQMSFKSQLWNLARQIKTTKRENKDRKECFKCRRKWSTNEILPLPKLLSIQHVVGFYTPPPFTSFYI